ncbi:hypothetical protein [Actinorugispora endophytica]|uniref:Uncharacterized protein n=1 Tax=Actinorugispora endophytica TaxID=1605990 RepID=A0A4V3D8S8_9ACTN|nr:hypothetical protein [Actinorugispora endophytica]TDQ52971.1 hypothetical protein EV190_10588 [Actinorugispora endophytica]
MTASRRMARYRAWAALALLGVVLLGSWLADAHEANTALSALMALTWVMLVFREKGQDPPPAAPRPPDPSPEGPPGEGP